MSEKAKKVVAKLSRNGKEFEILVDSDKARDYKEHKGLDIHDVVIGDAIFSDLGKAERAKEEDMVKIFGTDDFSKVSAQILDRGEIQLTTEQKREYQEQKKKKIVQLIARQATDPRTHTPHPPARIETAIEQSKARIDMFKSADSQVKEIIDAIRPILPISFEKKTVALKIPVQHAGRARKIVTDMAKILDERWIGQYWTVKVEVGAGMEEELYKELNNLTHGELLSEVINK